MLLRGSDSVAATAAVAGVVGPTIRTSSTTVSTTTITITTTMTRTIAGHRAPVFLLLLTLISLYFSSSAAVPYDSSFFLPSTCLADGDGTCCPVSYGAICGGSLRGECRNVMNDDVVCDNTNHQAGLWWFSDYFTSVCVCSAGFEGIDCADCAPGFSGERCNITTAPIVRRDFASMPHADQVRVVNAFATLKTTPSFFHDDVTMYDWLVAVHVWAMQGVATNPDLPTADYGYGHGGPAAPTWHRAYSRLMEKALQHATGDSNLGLPYWDWGSSSANNADPVIRLFGGDGDPNSLLDDNIECRTRGELELTGCNCTVTQGPFAGWPVLGEWGLPLGDLKLARSFGCHEPSLPTEDVVDWVANLTWYNSTTDYSFRPMVGGLTMRPPEVYTWPPSEDGIDMHARVHRWLGGTMMGDYAPNDPIFFLHHSFVDLIFERWIRLGIEAGTYGMDNALPVTGGPTGHNLYECVGPVFPLQSHALMFRDSRELGYTYDYFIDGPGDDGSLPSGTTSDSSIDRSLHGSRSRGLYTDAAHVSAPKPMNHAKLAKATLASASPAASLNTSPKAVAAKRKRMMRNRH